MTTVAEVFGKRIPSLTAAHPGIAMQCAVGIELELEGINNLSVSGWNCTEDGSLRNGCEMVCSQPFNGQRLFRAIHELSSAVQGSGAEGTWRCSTHVHVDMRDANSNILKKTILAYCYYEKLLFKCSGFHRYRSNFCPAFAVVQAQLMNASNAFNYDGADFFTSLVGSWDKYTSLNLLPLRDFGSIEFRISEPKWKRSQLLNLVNRYLVLKKLAVDNAEMSNDAFVEHLNNIRFSPMIDHLPLDYTPMESDLDEGYRLARDVMYCRHNDVEVAGRLRIRSSAPNETYNLNDIGHYNEFMGYIRRNGVSVYQQINEQFASQISEGSVTEADFHQMIALLRSSGSSNENIHSYIPDVWENDLRRLQEED